MENDYVTGEPDAVLDELKHDYPVSTPDFESGGKTNEWRLKKPVVAQDKCIKCLICWMYCPEATIYRKEDNSVDINYDYCKGCGICAKECPTKAIDMADEVD